VITTCNDDNVETAQEAYGRMIREELDPLLHSIGLTHAQDQAPPGTYELATASHFALLGLPEYWGNTSFRFQFTVEVLVISHADWDTFRTGNRDPQGNDWGPRPHVAAHYGPKGPWTERLGHLMGVGDRWWYVSPRRPTLPIAEEVTTDIQQYAIPEMRRRTT
jgi:hypothetical protein